MSHYRENTCKYYICEGECSKGRKASHKNICQTCDKYFSRGKMHKESKRSKLEKIIKNEKY